MKPLARVPAHLPRSGIREIMDLAWQVEKEGEVIHLEVGQPDFATITIRYIPDQRIVESKSLKLYLWSFRDEGHFHEHVTNRILDDLVAALDAV